MENNKDRDNRPKILLVVRAAVINKEGKILLMKRYKDDTWMPGKWELPGGKVDLGQDASNAMEREVLEETGLVIIPTDKVVYWNSEIVGSGKYKGLPYLAIVGTAKPVAGEINLSKEHDDYTWLTIKEALQKDVVFETRQALTVLSKKLESQDL